MFDLFTYLATSDEHGKQHLMNSFEDIIRSKGINGDERIITYEGSLNTLFGASCRGWYLFNLLGHSNVQVLDGGLAAWQKEGLPLVAGEEQTYTTEGSFCTHSMRSSISPSILYTTILSPIHYLSPMPTRTIPYTQYQRYLHCNMES